MKTHTCLKTLFTAFVFTVAASVSAQEAQKKEQQDRKTVEELAIAETEAIAIQLGQPLTSEQADRLTEINLEFFKQKQELKDRQASDQEFIPLYQSREEAMKSVLTEQQFKTWKENPVARKIQEEIKQAEARQKKQSEK